jgi:hypothetical protein
MMEEKSVDTMKIRRLGFGRASTRERSTNLVEDAALPASTTLRPPSVLW